MNRGGKAKVCVACDRPLFTRTRSSITQYTDKQDFDPSPQINTDITKSLPLLKSAISEMIKTNQLEPIESQNELKSTKSRPQSASALRHRQAVKEGNSYVMRGGFKMPINLDKSRKRGF